MGQHVEVTASAAQTYPVAAVTTEGVLGPGDDIGRGDRPQDEAFVFLLDSGVSSFCVERGPWKAATWDGSVLRAVIGPLELTVAPADQHDAPGPA